MYAKLSKNQRTRAAEILEIERGNREEGSAGQGRAGQGDWRMGVPASQLTRLAGHTKQEAHKTARLCLKKMKREK